MNIQAVTRRQYLTTGFNAVNWGSSVRGTSLRSVDLNDLGRKGDAYKRKTVRGLKR